MKRILLTSLALVAFGLTACPSEEKPAEPAAPAMPEVKPAEAAPAPAAPADAAPADAAAAPAEGGAPAAH
jgi:2-oxoglutarate dehydrogenase E2 component (dihydrolipoamide succinyltransferase)